MPADKPTEISQEVLIHLKRAGVPPEPALCRNMEKALAEIQEAGRIVRQGIERNDEPASAFHVPWEKTGATDKPSGKP